MIVSKEQYIKNLVDIYTSLLNQSIACVHKKWDDLQLDMTHVDFEIYCGDDERIKTDFEEQYVMNILGALNMASVRSNLGARQSPNNTEVDVVEFLLNDEEKTENPNSSQIQ